MTSGRRSAVEPPEAELRQLTLFTLAEEKDGERQLHDNPDSPTRKSVDNHPSVAASPTSPS
jgi:hypothetical protein